MVNPKKYYNFLEYNPENYINFLDLVCFVEE